MADRGSIGRRRVVFALLIALLAGFLWLASRRGWLSSPPEHRVLALYGYSSLDEVMTDGVFPAFRSVWLEKTGEKLEFLPTFAGSGEITRKILDRYPAEIAIVSSELDAYRLPVPFESWKSSPHGGVLARTPLVIVTRSGNPYGVAGFADLREQRIPIIHGDPVTSGLANLAVIAIYNEAIGEDNDPELGYQALADYWKNVSIRVPSARESRRHFSRAEAEAFITYEQDVVATPTRPEIDGEIVRPVHTLLVEPVVVRIDKNIAPGQRALVDAFMEFLWGAQGQEILVQYGFHSAGEDSAVVGARAVVPRGEVTLDMLGGASAVKREILDVVWRGKVPGLAN